MLKIVSIFWLIQLQVMVSSFREHQPLISVSHTGVMDYDKACFMHLTPGVVHNFPKAVGV